MLFAIVLNVGMLAQIAFQTDFVNLITISLSSKLFTSIIGIMALVTLIHLTVRGKIQKWYIFKIITVSVLGLIATSSRSSSIAYVVSISAFLLMYKKFRYFLFAVILFSGISYLDTDLFQRWSQTVQFKDIIINAKT